ncbi:hypothetical protein [Clostridium sp.]|uniref:hypothetical protein n=1 Tax=Clostridium sp. TaxID=1506 RepID=UPI003D6CBC8C
MDNETKKMFEILIKKLDTIEENQKEMYVSQKNMEIRQDEIFSVVNAIELSNTTHKAEIDNISKHKLPANADNLCNGVASGAYFMGTEKVNMR